MCGGIVLSQGIASRDERAMPERGKRLVPSLLYNAGRVISYTVIGGMVGALGSLFSLSTALKGAMPIIAGAFMLFLGVRMLGIIPWLSRLKVRFPGIKENKVSAAAAGRGPFVVGLLNGLMPCGPLQTMQVYALGTGSWYAGALSNVHLQRRHRAPAPRLWGHQLLSQHEVQSTHAQGKRRPCSGPWSFDVHPGAQPLRRCLAEHSADIGCRRGHGGKRLSDGHNDGGIQPVPSPDRSAGGSCQMDDLGEGRGPQQLQ